MEYNYTTIIYTSNYTIAICGYYQASASRVWPPRVQSAREGVPSNEASAKVFAASLPGTEVIQLTRCMGLPLNPSYVVLGAFGVLLAFIATLLPWLFRGCPSCLESDSQTDRLAEQDSAAGASDSSDSSDVAHTAIEMQSMPIGGITSEWEPALVHGLSPDDADYRNKFIRGGL